MIKNDAQAKETADRTGPWIHIVYVAGTMIICAEIRKNIPCC